MISDARERQGGDLRDLGLVQLDLSTCVNPYGPPDTVLAALRGMSADAIRRHPYGAAQDVEAAYATYTGQPVTWDQALNAKDDLSPKQYAFGPNPVPPPAVPGMTKLS